jgi:hypothetical protein
LFSEPEQEPKVKIQQIFIDIEGQINNKNQGIKCVRVPLRSFFWQDRGEGGIVNFDMLGSHPGSFETQDR